MAGLVPMMFGMRCRSQPAALERAVEHDQQVVDLDRLGHVVGGALLHGGHGAGDRAERGHQDHHPLGIVGAGARGQLEAVEPGHLEVGEQQLGGELGELGQRLEAVGGGLDLIALVAQELGQRGPRVGLVVDDQDAASRGHGRARSPPARPGFTQTTGQSA
jgi:hypothetical protein